MPARSRPPLDPIDDWRQLDLLVQFPEQRTYELIRPVVLAGHSPAERTRQTGLQYAPCLARRRASPRRGWVSLFVPTRTEPHFFLDPAIRDAILSLKAEHTALKIHELTTICWVRFSHRPSARAVKRVFATHPLPSGQPRRYARYNQIADPAEARLAIVRLHLEGWNAKNIPAYLANSRDIVHATLHRWVAEAIAGLADKSHAAQYPAWKVTPKAMLAIKELQESPELGAWRMHAADARQR